jgi:uncharacterized phage protein (TIGR01671 family)
MRKFKFRAWDASDREMVDMLFTDPDGWFIGFFDGANEGKNNVLMQFTGIKDKNGIDIYDGDIVRVESNGSKFAVEYVDNAMQFVFTKEIGNKDALSIKLSNDREKRKKQVETLEVVGNVYENPELLEA